jgi:flagellar brake protein
MAIKDDQERYYTSPGDIFGVLRALQNDRSPLTVQFSSGGTFYNSLVLDVNIKERYLLLDELTPRDGHALMEAGKLFSLRASINGIRVHARDMRSARTLSDATGILYRVPFPERMLYLQRRDAFRARVPGSLMVNASAHSGKRPDTILQGKVIDMSATGVRVAFAGETSPPLEIGEILKARIEIPSQDQSIDCQLEVRNQDFNRDRDQTICGLRFHELGRIAQVTVNRFVTQLQREGLA